MADAQEHAAAVLAAIIPNRRDLLDLALRHLGEEHFTDPVHARLFRFLERYHNATSEVVPRKYLDDLVAKKESSTLLLIRETYDELAETSVADSDFHWSMKQIRELAAERQTGDAITESMNLLRHGSEDEDEPSHVTARNYLQDQFLAIERGMQLEESPEGTINEEGDEILEEYLKAKADREAGVTDAIKFGIEELDARTGGMRPGELIISAAYSGEGKSTLAVQTAWHAAYVQGKNVVFFTTETIRKTIRRKLIARHSVLAKFGLGQGLNTKNLKEGTLTDQEFEALGEIVKDMSTNPDYGRVHIVQVPRADSIMSLERRMRRIQKQFNIDLVIMDYLALLVPESRRNTSREELSGIIKEAKKIATTFNDGKGVPFLSPWQVNRQAREDAERNNGYTSRALSETAEATNSADLIISLLAPMDNFERRAELNMQVLKHRDGETAQSISVEVDYATSAFRSRGAMIPGTVTPSVLSLDQV